MLSSSVLVPVMMLGGIPVKTFALILLGPLELSTLGEKKEDEDVIERCDQAAGVIS